MKTKNIVLSILICCCLAYLIARPQNCSTNFFNGVKLWGVKILPTLFPFTFFTKILVELGGIQALSVKSGKAVKKLFNAPDCLATAYTVNLLCGYPLGAKTICELYENKQISSTNCQKLAIVCSNASPIFVLSTVGTGMLDNISAGIIIYFCHLLSTIIIAFATRNLYIDNYRYIPRFLSKNDNILSQAMTSTITASLSVGGYIALFSTLSGIAKDLIPQGLSAFTPFIIGILEMSNGCYTAASSLPVESAAILCCAFVSFGGFCVIMQLMEYYKKCRVNCGIVLLFKFIQGAIATLLCFFAVKIFL